MKKIIKFILIIALVALIIIQFIRPEINNGGYESVAFFEAEAKPSVEVAVILKQNCYDCHSNQTQYPWYSYVAPFSFWLEDHIKHGKGEFNVSKWDTYSLKRKEHKMEEVVEMVKKGEMPLDSYTWIHGNLEEGDKELLLQWASMAQMQYQELMNASPN